MQHTKELKQEKCQTQHKQGKRKKKHFNSEEKKRTEMSPWVLLLLVSNGIHKQKDSVSSAARRAHTAYVPKQQTKKSHSIMAG
eukprot:895846-Pelagomonas_calceolata.AAC.3